MQLRDTRTVVFAGDSVTDCGWRDGAGHGLGDGYVRLVADALDAQLGPDAPRLINSGTGGDRIVDLEQRWRSDVLGHRPDLVSVLVGVNDTWRRYDRGLHTPATEFEARYDRMLAAAAASAARLVLVEPFVVPVDDGQRAWAEDLDAKRAAVQRLAGTWSAVLVRTQDAMDRSARQVGATTLAADGVHPTAMGHRLLADLWLAAVLDRAGDAPAVRRAARGV